MSDYISGDRLLQYHQGLKNIFANKATTLSGYGITDAMTEAEIRQAITDAVGEITGISFEIVTSLPTTGVAGTIYMISNSGTGQNIYDEYIYVNSKWEKIGTTDVDLSGYWQKTALTEATESDINTILAS